MAFAVSTDYMSNPDPPGSGVTFHGSWSGQTDSADSLDAGFNWGYTSVGDNFVADGSFLTGVSGSFTAGVSPVNKDVDLSWQAQASANLSGVTKTGSISTDKTKADAATLGTPTNDTPLATSCVVHCVVSPNTVSSSGTVTCFYKKTADPSYTQTAVLATLSGTPGTATVNGTLSGLSASTAYTYFFRIVRNTVNLATADSVTATFTTAASGPPPAAPSALTTGAITSSTIALSWTDNSTNEDGFKVYRCSNSSTCTPSTLVTTTAANVISFTDSGLVANTLYRYAVTSFNAAGGESAQSNVVTATTLPVDPMVSIF
jgi:hypothetical protein